MKRVFSILLSVIFVFNSIFGFASPVGMNLGAKMMPSYHLGGLDLSLALARGLEVVDGDLVFAWDERDLGGDKEAFLKAFFTALQLRDEHLWVDLGLLKSVDEVLDPALRDTVIGKVFIKADIELKKAAMEMMKDAMVDVDGLGKFRLWIEPDVVEIAERVDGKGLEIRNIRLKVRAEMGEGIGDEMRRYIEGEMVKGLTKEVNEGKAFEELRKVFRAIALARWYKERAKKGWPYYEVAGKDVMNDSLREEWDIRRYLAEYGRVVFKTLEESDVPYVGGGVVGSGVQFSNKGLIGFGVPGVKDKLQKLGKIGSSLKGLRGKASGLAQRVGKKGLALLLASFLAFQSTIGSVNASSTSIPKGSDYNLELTLQEPQKETPPRKKTPSTSQQQTVSPWERIESITLLHSGNAAFNRGWFMRRLREYSPNITGFLNDAEIKQIQAESEKIAKELLPEFKKLSPDKFKMADFDFNFITDILICLPKDSPLSKAFQEEFKRLFSGYALLGGDYGVPYFAKLFNIQTNVVVVYPYILWTAALRYTFFGEAHWKEFFEAKINEALVVLKAESLKGRSPGYYDVTMLGNLSYLAANIRSWFFDFKMDRAEDVARTLVDPFYVFDETVFGYFYPRLMNELRTATRTQIALKLLRAAAGEKGINALIWYSYPIFLLAHIDVVRASFAANLFSVTGLDTDGLNSEVIERLKRGKLFSQLQHTDMSMFVKFARRVVVLESILEHWPYFYQQRQGIRAEDLILGFSIGKKDEIAHWLLFIAQRVPILIDLKLRLFSQVKGAKWTKETAPILAFLSLISEDGLSPDELIKRLKQIGVNKNGLFTTKYLPFWMAVIFRGQVKKYLVNFDISPREFGDYLDVITDREGTGVILREIAYGLDYLNPDFAGKNEVLNSIAETRGADDPLAAFIRSGKWPSDSFRDTIWEKLFVDYKNAIEKDKIIQIIIPVKSKDRQAVEKALKDRGFSFIEEKDAYVKKISGKKLKIFIMNEEEPWDSAYLFKVVLPDRILPNTLLFGLPSEVTFDTFNLFVDTSSLFHLGYPVLVFKGDKAFINWFNTDKPSWCPIVGAKSWKEVLIAMELFIKHLRLANNGAEFLDGLRKALDEKGLYHISIANHGKSLLLLHPRALMPLKKKVRPNSGTAKLEIEENKQTVQKVSTALKFLPLITALALLPSMAFAGVGDVVAGNVDVLFFAAIVAGFSYFAWRAIKDIMKSGDLWLSGIDLAFLRVLLANSGLIEMEDFRKVWDEIFRAHPGDVLVQDAAWAYWFYNRPQLLEVLRRVDDDFDRKMKSIKVLAEWYEKEFVKKGRGIDLEVLDKIANIKPGGIDLREVVLTPVNYGMVSVGM